jgi:hypothetical protein
VTPTRALPFRGRNLTDTERRVFVFDVCDLSSAGCGYHDNGSSGTRGPPAPVAPVQPLATCTATVSNPTPSGGTETVTVHASTSGIIVVNAHYESTMGIYSGSTDSAGNGTVSFSISSPTKGYTVVVDLIVGHKAQCSTEFTPQ